MPFYHAIILLLLCSIIFGYLVMWVIDAIIHFKLKGFTCHLGIHDWDGHTSHEYPAPQCRHCGEWHSRKKLEGPIFYDA